MTKSKNTAQFFKKINLSFQLFFIDPTLWAEQDDYKRAEKRVLAQKVVNDPAERGIALVQRYNKLLTKSEGQFQFLYR